MFIQDNTIYLKLMSDETLNNLHNRLRRELGYDSDRRIDYDQLDPEKQAMYCAVDDELCTRRHPDQGKVGMMLAEELIKSASQASKPGGNWADVKAE